MKNKEIKTGLSILLIGTIIGIIIVALIAESDYPSMASNDGWLGFFGGLFGSIISGGITFFVLYINRKDAKDMADENKKQTDMIQLQNKNQFYDNMKQQSAILMYQCNMKICDDVMQLVAELIKIAEDYYINVSDNTNEDYAENRYRISEICSILEMKLCNIKMSDKFIMQIKFYQSIFARSEIPHNSQKDRSDEIKQYSENLRKKTMELCSNMMKTDLLH